LELAASVEADGASTDERGEWPMCGRYVPVGERADLVELYNATAPDPVVAPPSYKVAPTQTITAVATSHAGAHSNLTPYHSGVRIPVQPTADSGARDTAE
jgi:putative SOS response-associated peptidase YedK